MAEPAEPLPVHSLSVPLPVYPDLPNGLQDISNIVSKRLRALRQLQENHNDVQALSVVYAANQELMRWSVTNAPKQMVEQLNADAQADICKDQFVTGAPVNSGIDISLQKISLRPGEGLEKNNMGSLKPLSLETKIDKRVTQEDPKDIPYSRQGSRTITDKKSKHSTLKSLPDLGQIGRINTYHTKLYEKDPISLLYKFCRSKRWNSPMFEIADESGPAHKKRFLFRVKVNGKKYKPETGSRTKKLAKAKAATVCLQKLGVATD